MNEPYFIEEDNGLVTSRWDDAGPCIYSLGRELEWLSIQAFSPAPCKELVLRRRELLEALDNARRREGMR